MYRAPLMVLIFLLSYGLLFWSHGVADERIHPEETVKSTPLPFYLFKDYGAKDDTHYYATGKMGNSIALTVSGNCSRQPFRGGSCIKVTFNSSVCRKGEETWAGMYWLDPPNNWGLVEGAGYALNGAQRLVFHARGEKGGEIVEFGMGGIEGKYPDSGRSDRLVVRLGTEWKKYEIPLEGIDMSIIIGGFFILCNEEANRSRTVFYLDEIYYE